MSWLTDIPLAHRGLHDLSQGVLENTLPAFTRARDAGVGVELDVWLSRDGVPVVTHDVDLVRLAGRPELVAQLTAATLSTIELCTPGARIPTLSDVLDLLAGAVPVMVEIKNPRATAGSLEAAVARVVRSHGEQVAIASFNPRTVGWFRRHAPQVLRGQTAGTFRDTAGLPTAVRRYLQSLVSNRWTQPHYVSYELDGLPNPAVEAWRRRGLPLVTWTVRTPEELDRARRLADNLIFELLPPASVLGGGAS